MKKTAQQNDKTNFSIGISQGFGAMKNRVGFAIFGLLIGLVGGFKWANADYRHTQGESEIKRIEEAKKNVQNGAPSDGQQMPAQITEMIKKAKENPNDFAAQQQAAALFMQVRRPEGALPFLAQANKLQPENGEIMGELAGAHFFQGNYADSINWARKTLVKEPTSRQAKFYLASSLILSKQNLAEAEKLLNQVEAETQGAPDDAKQVLTSMRQRLRDAKAGGTATTENKGEAKTSLQHGAESGGNK